MRDEMAVFFLGLLVTIGITYAAITKGSEGQQENWFYNGADDICVINMNAPIVDRNEWFIECGMARDEK